MREGLWVLFERFLEGALRVRAAPRVDANAGGGAGVGEGRKVAMSPCPRGLRQRGRSVVSHCTAGACVCVCPPPGPE